MFETTKKRTYKFHPLAETLHLYQFLTQLRINGAAVPPQSHLWYAILDYAYEKDIIKIPALRKHLSSKKQQALTAEDDLFNYQEDQEINTTPSLNGLRKAWGPLWDTLSENTQTKLWLAVVNKEHGVIKKIAHKHHAHLNRTLLRTLSKSKRKTSPMQEVHVFQTYLDQLRFANQPLSNAQREHVIALVYKQDKIKIQHIKTKVLGNAAITCNKNDNETLPKLENTKCMQKLLGSVWDTLIPDTTQDPYQYTLSRAQEDCWHTIFRASSDNTRAKTILKKASKKWGFNGDLYGSNGYQARYQALEKLAKSYKKRITAKLSQKAMRYIIPHLQKGYTYDKAVMLGSLHKLIQETPAIPNQDTATLHQYLDGLFAEAQSDQSPFEQLKAYLQQTYKLTAAQLKGLWHHSRKDKHQPANWPDPEDVKDIQLIPPSNNPVVSTAHFETGFLTTDILHVHKVYAGQINIEVSSDLKAPARKKDAIKKKQAQNRAVKDKARRKLIEAGYAPTERNIKKYRLWLACKEECVYTKTSISFEDLFKKQLFDLEHIVPKSVSFDNSLFNLTLCEKEENRQVKKKQTPWQAYHHNPEKWEAIKQRAKKSFSKAKYEHFIQEGHPKALEAFAPRDATNTSYITRHLSQELGKHLPSTIHTVQGRATQRLRTHWQLDELLSMPIPITTDKGGYYFLALDATGTIQDHAHWVAPRALFVEAVEEDKKAKQKTLNQLREEAFEVFKNKKVPQAILDKERGGKKSYKTRYHCLQGYVKIAAEARPCRLLEDPNTLIDLITSQPGYYFLALGDNNNVLFKRHWLPPALSSETLASEPKMIQEQLAAMRQKDFGHFVEAQKAHQAQNPDKPRHKAYVQGHVTLEKKERLCYPMPRKNRADHRHHLIDAAIVAVTGPKTIAKLSQLAKEDRLYKATLDEKLPWPAFKQQLKAQLDKCMISRYARENIFSLKEALPKKGQKNDKKHKYPQAHGQLHKETIYGGGQLTNPKRNERTLYIRKPIDSLTPSQITNIKDRTIKHMLVARLVEKLDANAYAALPLTSQGIPVYKALETVWNNLKANTKAVAEALKNIIWQDIYKDDSDDKKPISRKPQFLLPVKRGKHKGQHVPIKRIRIETKSTTAVPLDDDEKKWVEPGNNEVFAFYAKEDGSWFSKGYSLWEAVTWMREQKQEKAFTPPNQQVDPRDGQKGRLCLLLRKQNYYLLGLEIAQIKDLQHLLWAEKSIDYHWISKYLYRCQKITDNDFTFRKYLEATEENPLAKQRITSMAKLIEKNPTQIIINRLGKLSEIKTFG